MNRAPAQHNDRLFTGIKKPPRLFEEVVNQIEYAIVEGKLSVGESLPSERALSESFSISRRTLREALRVLEQKGLIEVRMNGIYVKEPSSINLAQDFALLLRRCQVSWENIIQFRQVLDATIARLATQNATDDDIMTLDTLLEQGDTLLAQKTLDWEGYLALDIQIHLQLARMSGNPVNEWILTLFLDNMKTYYNSYGPKKRLFSTENWANVKNLVEAIKAEDPEEAARQATLHLSLGTQYVWLERIKKRQQPV